MRWECPAGMRQYAEVLVRVAPDYRRGGDSIQFRCPFPERHRKGGGDARPSAWAKIGGGGELVCRCSACGAGFREFVAYSGLPAPHWFPRRPDDTGRAAAPQRRRPMVKPKVVAEYPYTDWRTGELVAVKLRWEPGFQEGHRKDFSWRRPLPAAYRKAANVPAGAKAWCGGPGVLRGGEFSFQRQYGGEYFFRPTTPGDSHSFTLPPLEVGPYREYEARQTDRAVFVTEGEGKADFLVSLGFVAVSAPNGKGSWEREWGAVFWQRTVIVVPDRDPPDDRGLGWAERVLGTAVGYNAAAVCVPLVPRDGFPDDASVDVKDWLLRLDPAARPGAVKRLVAGHQMYKRGV